MAGTTSQPSLSALVAATDHTERATGLDLRAVMRPRAVLGGRPRALRAVRVRAAVADRPGVPATRSPAASCPTCASRRSRSAWARSSSRSRTMYAAADRILGRIVKVTPSSKVVGDLALHLVGGRRRPGRVRRRTRPNYDIPDSVIGFLSGELGDPPGGWPEPFRTKALAGPHRQAAREPSCPTSDADADLRRPTRGATLNRLLFPGPTKEFDDVARDVRRPVRAADTLDYLYGLRPGDEHDVALEPGVRPDRSGWRRSASPTSGACAPSCARINGQLRPLQVRDRVGRGRRPGRREGRPGQPGPRRGAVRRRGDARRSPRATSSRPAQTVATIEAMKMEAAITAPVAGTVAAARPRLDRSRSKAATSCWS